MFEDGDLMVTICDGRKECEHEPDHYDERGAVLINEPIGIFHLPHQCGDWVIGTREDALRLRDALNRVLGFIK